MFDTDLPLALIMEEILGWEKKSGDKEKEQQAEQEPNPLHQLQESIGKSRRKIFRSSFGLF